jgi:hypothetical protein
VGLRWDRNSPPSKVVSRRYDFLPSIPPPSNKQHWVSFVWRYLGCTRGYAPRRTSAPSRPGVGNPVSPSGNFQGHDRSSQVPGKPLFVCACSNPTPAGLLAPDHHGAAAWPLVIVRQRLPQWGFRRSIAWLSNSLRAPCLMHGRLRSAGYPDPTQDSLPVAGQALLDGNYTRKVSMKGFKGVSYISFPSPKLCLAQTMWPPARNESSLTAVQAVGQ